MTVEEYLMGYQDSIHRLRYIEEEQLYLRANLTRTTPGDGGIGVSHGTNVNKIPDAIARSEELDKEYQEESARAVQTMKEVRNCIMSVSDTKLRDVLTMRYILGYPIKNIAAELGVSPNRASELHRKAISSIVEYIRFKDDAPVEHLD